MQADRHTAGRGRARRAHYLIVALFVASGLFGCAAPAQPVSLPAVAAPVAPPASAAMPAPSAAEAMLAYAERIRALAPPELIQEINVLGDPQDSPARQLQLAIALAAARTPANAARAQSLLQRVLAQTQSQAQVLHPLARMLLAQQAETRRLEEQLERQHQQTREAHRRIDQLNDRLEALRAMERSLLVRPAAAVAAPANNRPTP